ncbi:MAG: MBL fold metallo-hydrolase [Elusimicrobiales bacterium]|nr:MBL fold metallo-hydrolase [Elusimicrobiales bacterium]NLH38592.1 MBL fold metallo-hydrolase [Elusimicrobiota bacterium]
MIKIKQIKVGKMDNLMYIVSGAVSFIVIDPSWGFDEIENYISETGKTLKAVLLTHGHFDHTMDIRKIRDAHKDVDFYISERDLVFIDYKFDFKFLSDDQILKIDDIEVKTIHTPGHSAGGYCFLIGKYLFTGDTLFQGLCGRVDLPYSDPEEMRKSLLKLSELDDSTVVFPGHSYNSLKTTIGAEKKDNIYMRSANDKEKFLSVAL